MRHIKNDLGVSSAGKIEEQPFYGKKDEKEKYSTFKMNVSSQRDV